MKPPLYLKGMGGMGDNVYSRPFVRAATVAFPEVYYETPWPELFTDLPVKCVPHPNRKLRTQRKNMDRTDLYCEPPKQRRERLMGYPTQSGRTIVEGLAERLPFLAGPLVFDLPDTGPSPVRSSRPVAVIRPVVVRTEWLNHSRNPDPAYVAQATAILRERGFYTVSVADLDPPAEVGVCPEPPAERKAHRGEFSIKQLVALIRHADVVVGGPGFILPIGMATWTPVVVIGGGQGFYNSPEFTIGPWLADRPVKWIQPAPFCRCRVMDHDCNKAIPDFERQFESALDEVTSDSLAAVA